MTHVPAEVTVDLWRNDTDQWATPSAYSRGQFSGRAADAHGQRQDWREECAYTAARRVRSLTERQREVLDQMICGYLNKEIAWHLGIDEKTVKMHRKDLIQRLGVETSASAIRIGVQASFAEGNRKPGY